MNRPTRSQWIVLWLGALWVLLCLAIAEDYVVRAAVAGFIVTALLYWQLAPTQRNPSTPPRSLDRRLSSTSMTSLSFPPSDADPRLTNKGPDAEFIGEFLAANFLFEHFGLKDDDFARLTGELPTELRGPAKLWIIIYACWLYRMTVKAKYGEAFFDAAIGATRRRLGRKVDGFDGTDFIHALEFWFDKLDDATKSLGMKFQDVELPFEVFAAWSFLALDADSPYQGKTEFSDQLDLAVADCLEKAKASTLRLIKFTVEIGGPLPENAAEAKAITDAALSRIERDAISPDEAVPLTWSASPGPSERHLLRRHGNVLFPQERRVVVQDQIDLARERDQASLRHLVEGLRETLEKVLAMPDFASMDQCKQILDELDDLRTQCLVHSGQEAMRWQTQIESAAERVVSAMKESLSESVEKVRPFEEWRETLRVGQTLFQNQAVLEVRRVPKEDVVPTVCSFDPGDIALLVESLGSDLAALETLRAACANVLTKAVDEGFPSEKASERLRALGVNA